MTRDERIARASEVCRSRVYSVDMDRPTMVMFHVAAESFESARSEALRVCHQLHADEIPAGFGSPTRAGTWYQATITVQVGR